MECTLNEASSVKTRFVLLLTCYHSILPFSSEQYQIEITGTRLCSHRRTQYCTIVTQDPNDPSIEKEKENRQCKRKQKAEKSFGMGVAH